MWRTINIHNIRVLLLSVITVYVVDTRYLRKLSWVTKQQHSSFLFHSVWRDYLMNQWQMNQWLCRYGNMRWTELFETEFPAALISTGLMRLWKRHLPRLEYWRKCTIHVFWLSLIFTGIVGQEFKKICLISDISVRKKTKEEKWCTKRQVANSYFCEYFKRLSKS